MNVLIKNRYFKEELEESRRVIIIRKSKKDRQHNGQKKKDKRATIYKTLHIKLKIE
jgi:hypothetical protein